MPNYYIVSHSVCNDLLKTGHTADHDHSGCMVIADHDYSDCIVTTDLDLKEDKQDTFPLNDYEDVSFSNDYGTLHSHRFSIDRVNHEERLALEKIDNDIYNSLLDDANHHESRHKLYRSTTFILSGLLVGVLTYIWIK